MPVVEQGALYVTGTPIGNLQDMTFRQLEVLNAVSFIAAEDTRVTRGLLTHYDIHKPLVSYHAHKLSDAEIINRMTAGESCAIVTDAGMPCISDPGEVLVQHCVEQGIPVYVVPGPSAAVSALAISGLSTARFAFEGFLSTVKKERTAHLESLKQDVHTLIFYEAPHKLCATLGDLLEALGDRKVSLCRELTKLHEEVQRMTLSEAAAYYQTHTPRGEFVLVVEGASIQNPERPPLEDALRLVQAELQAGVRLTEACKNIAKETGYSKNELYQRMAKQL